VGRNTSEVRSPLMPRVRTASPEQIERWIRGFGVHQFGMLQQAAQGQRRGVIAHDRDPNPGPVRVGDAADRGAGRHQIGIVQFKPWRRKADLPGANRTTVRKPDTSETQGKPSSSTVKPADSVQRYMKPR